VFEWLKNLLFQRVAFELVSKHSLDESIRILSQGKPQPPFAPDAIVNPKRIVSAEEVTLAVYQPFFSNFRNDFKACFVGAFVQDGPTVVLRGVFRYPYWVSVFMLVWLSVNLLIALHPVAKAAGLVFFGFGLLLTLLGKLTFRTDIKYLSSYLKELLQ
jgi:hypothetical protein